MIATAEVRAAAAGFFTAATKVQEEAKAIREGNLSADRVGLKGFMEARRNLIRAVNRERDADSGTIAPAQ